MRSEVGAVLLTAALGAAHKLLHMHAARSFTSVLQLCASTSRFLLHLNLKEVLLFPFMTLQLWWTPRSSRTKKKTYLKNFGRVSARARTHTHAHLEPVSLVPSGFLRDVDVPLIFRSLAWNDDSNNKNNNNNNSVRKAEASTNSEAFSWWEQQLLQDLTCLIRDQDPPRTCNPHPPPTPSGPPPRHLRHVLTFADDGSITGSIIGSISWCLRCVGQVSVHAERLNPEKRPSELRHYKRREFLRRSQSERRLFDPRSVGLCLRKTVQAEFCVFSACLFRADRRSADCDCIQGFVGSVFCPCHLLLLTRREISQSIDQ